MKMYVALVLLLSVSPIASAADHPGWGQPHSRNMVSEETGLPSKMSLEAGGNLKWEAALGTKAYGTPVISGGKVLIGADNNKPRDPLHKGDSGVLLCLDEKDGSLIWQLVIPRMLGDIYKDWPQISLCSPPTVEGNRVYMVTNRYEVVCLDLNGLADGNDGPYLNEAMHMVRTGDKPAKVNSTDADIIWVFDMIKDAGIYPHDSAHSSALIDGQFLYMNTCNGVDNTHRANRCPDAPSLIVLDKRTGRLVAQDKEGMGALVYHSTWAPPALGEVNGQRLIFFGGGDGVCYAFKALSPSFSSDKVVQLERVWRFDCDPTAPKKNIHSYKRNQLKGPTNIKSTPVFDNDRLYVTVGGDIWWGKREAWLICIDAKQKGDITESGKLWSYPLELHTCSTPSVYKGMVFVADCGGKLHCVDADSGKALWTHDLGREVWSSTLVADGKVYIGTRRGELWTFAADKEKRVLDQVRLDSSISAAPVTANGVLYIATLKTLYAFGE